MSQDEPNQPIDDEAASLADLIGKPGIESQPMQVVEADTPEKLKRKRKPKSLSRYWPMYMRFIAGAVMLVMVGAGIALLLVPTKIITVPVFVTATPLPYPWPTPTAAFGSGVGMSGYDYLTLQDIQPSIPANTRVRLNMAYFDGQQWHYEIVAEGEQNYGEALESQLAFVPINYNELILTPSATPLPTFTPTPTFVG